MRDRVLDAAAGVSLVGIGALLALSLPSFGAPPGSTSRSAGTLPANSVSYSEMQQVSADDTLLGQDGTAPANVEEIALGAPLSMTSANTLGIAANAIPIADIVNAGGQYHALMRSSASAGAWQDVTGTAAGLAMWQAADAAAQVALMPAGTTALKGTGFITPATIPIIRALTTLTSAPATPQEIGNSGTTHLSLNGPNDLTNRTQFRVTGRQLVAASSGTVICAFYSTDGGTTVVYLETGTTVADGGCASTTGKIAMATGANTSMAGSWVNIASGGKADVSIGLYTDDGNASASPTVNEVDVQVR